MIGAVVLSAARRRVGPREVLQAAPLRMRVQFWFLVGSGVVLATVPVVARGETMPVEQWITDWRFLTTLGLWIFSAGAVWAQFNSLKERIAAMEASSVKKDTLNDKLENINTKIDGLHEKIALLVGTADWRDRLHGTKE